MFNGMPTDVLVVDDDESVRELLALRLRMLNHEAHSAASIEEAIDTLEAEHVDAVEANPQPAFRQVAVVAPRERRQRLQPG
jgi:CheY-like chemotaxis protein